jgi:hypothetical protein
MSSCSNESSSSSGWERGGFFDLGPLFFGGFHTEAVEAVEALTLEIFSLLLVEAKKDLWRLFTFSSRPSYCLSRI